MLTRISRILRMPSIAFLLLGVAWAHAAPPRSWSIESLGALGPRGSIAMAINDRGDVGGYSAVPVGFDQPFHAFVWSNGTMTDYGAALGNPPGSGYSQVTAINDRGVAVGTGPLGVLRWNVGVPAPEALGFTGSVADINNKGVIVGAIATGSGTHAYRYADGQLYDLGTLGGTSSAANAINDRGVIVGTSEMADGTTRGFIYDNGTMTAIGTFGGASSRATDINSHGVVIGEAQDATGTWQPFIIDKSGMRILENVPAGSTLHAINDRGAIIGTFTNPDNQGTTSFLWENGTVTLLDTLPEVQAAGWHSLFVMDINDRGWITGWGWKAGGPVDGVAFVLKPR